MKLAILVIFYWGYAVTSQTVPADKCKILGEQLGKYPKHYSCLYYEPGGE